MVQRRGSHQRPHALCSRASCSPETLSRASALLLGRAAPAVIAVKTNTEHHMARHSSRIGMVSKRHGAYPASEYGPAYQALHFLTLSVCDTGRLSRAGLSPHLRGKFLALFELLSEVCPDLGRIEIQECPTRLEMHHEALPNGIRCGSGEDRHRHHPDQRPYERHPFQRTAHRVREG